MSDAFLMSNIVYVSRELKNMTDLANEKLAVYPTFVYDPASPATGRTAHNWAEEKYTKDDAIELALAADVPQENLPFKIRIISLDVRTQGGRAYKVIDAENRLFDLRERQLLEAINLFGIDKGGYVGGEFVWGRVGAQTTLTLVGGTLHSEMTHAAELKSKLIAKRAAGAAITPSKCIPGQIYERLGKYYLFVGKLRQKIKTKDEFALLRLDEPDTEPYWELLWNEDFQERRRRPNVTPYKDASWADRVLQTLKFSHQPLSLTQSISSFSECVGEVDVNALKEARNFSYYKYVLDESEFLQHHPFPQMLSSWHLPPRNGATYDMLQKEHSLSVDTWLCEKLVWFAEHITWK